jgi:protein-tyrosine phosphatase
MHGVNAHRFAPAAPDEAYVFGSCAPGWHSAASHGRALDDWIAHMQDHDVERVCCLLSGRQLDQGGANVDRYRAAFGESNVCHAPAPDHHLLPASLVSDEILPFLADAREAEERVVVHCLAGIGRTGQALAAWLVYNRDYGPDRAIETVTEMGRDPRDAVKMGNASEGDLVELLATVARQ